MSIKTKIITTSKTKILVVGGLPNGYDWDFAFQVDVQPINKLLISVSKEDFDAWGINSRPKHIFIIPQGDWKLLGKLSESIIILYS